MKFTHKFVALELDLAGYKRFFNSYMEDWLKQAGVEWLHATVLAIIPTWSKASRATFQKLARELGTAIPYGEQKSRKDRAGLGLSTSQGSGLELDPGNSRWYFKYHTTLRYLAYNEYNHVVYGQAPNVFSPRGLTNPTPYHFQEKGQKAFEDFTRFTELPNPFKFLKKVKVS
ncbi:MAG: hypothetical protein AMS22_07510 [Thiotrichales bacterium SG8_50]|nr:MAG: hypothetical protein AMS22_07510 [Thiotrichales bacterium SG8_50]